MTGPAREIRTAVAIAVAWFAVSAAPVVFTAAAEAQESLSCGVPLQRHLDTGAVDEYALTVAAGSTVEIDVADAGTIGLIKLDGGGQETCTGSLRLNGPIDTVIEVSDCICPNDICNSGNYTLTANVLTQGADNCGVPMPCGLVPYVRHLSLPGEVDAYAFAGNSGDTVTLIAGDITGTTGSILVQLFDPDGEAVPNGNSCSAFVNLPLQKTGTYTALISTCGAPSSGLYSIAFKSPSCPAGPEITYFGVTLSDGEPRTPQSFDNEGRPVYMSAGSGFIVVVEARPGSDRNPVASSAFNSNLNDPSVLPDLQVLFSRPLGDGSPAVCDKTLPHQGGVPATPSLDYSDSQTVANAINDFGCRVDDGAGSPVGRPEVDACTLDIQSGDFHFVNSTTTLQFCAEIARTWSFPQGTTIVEARVRDSQGTLGPPREMVVQVGGTCAGDCNGDFLVTVDELLTAVNIALGNLPPTKCTAADLNGDGHVTIDEIIAAVNSSLNGCA